MKIYGITGGIGAGKSAVTAILRDLGYTVIDLDQVSRDVVEPGSPGLAKIVDTFGAAYINLEGTLNRRMLADLVFKNPDELAKLDTLMGPIIWNEVERQRALLEGDIAFLDGALIIEKKMNEKLDGMVLVTAPVEVRVQRAIARDNANAEQIRARVKAQMPDSEKRPFVDFVIENDGTFQDLRERTVALVEGLAP